MLTESQIEFCLSKIRVQLTMTTAGIRPNIDMLVGLIKQTIAEAYDDHRVDESASVYELGLDDRTATLLDNAGYSTIRSVTQANTKDIMQIKQVGVGMLEELRARLVVRGLKLRGDPSNAELRLIHKRKVAESRQTAIAETVL